MTVQVDEKWNAIDAALSHWRQGDCVVAEQWFVHRFSRHTPLTREATEGAAAEVDLSESAVHGFVVVTQTCDVVRSCSDRPYVEVAPLVLVDERELHVISRGQRPRYAFIPSLKDRCLVGDLDRAMTVEKSIVADWVRTPGCQTDQDVRRFAQALTRKCARFAFPDDFSGLVKKLQARLQEKHDKESPEGQALRELDEIRVRAASSWTDQNVDITFFFIRKSEAETFQGHGWETLLEKWLELVPPSGRFHSVTGIVSTLDDLTARDYVESDALDLDHLSTRDTK